MGGRGRGRGRIWHSVIYTASNLLGETPTTNAMPRSFRLWSPGSVQHLIARFVNRSFLMRSDVERAEYLSRLSDALAQCDWVLLGYALMSNHIHLAVVAGADPAQRLIQPLHGGFAAWLNHRQRRLGPVFATRFTALLCTPPNILDLLSYLHNNPVRAGVAKSASESSWTSHRAYVDLDEAPAWLAVERGLALCGLAGPRQRQQFAEAVAAQAAAPRDPRWSSHARSRRCVRAAVGGPVELSDPELRQDRLAHHVHAMPGTPLRPVWGGAVDAVLSEVARRTGVTWERMQRRDKAREVSRARRMALLAWQRLGRRQIEMSAALGIDSGTASHLLRRAPQVTAALAAEAEEVAQACWSSEERAGNIGILNHQE